MAWIDCLARGKAGRARYLHGGQSRRVWPPGLRQTLQTECSPHAAVFRDQPSVAASVQQRLLPQPSGRAAQQPNQLRAILYPLDRILNWNRIYGPRGFQQYQCVIPESNAAPATRGLLNAIADAHSGSFLAVLKHFGNVASPGLLSFPMPGVTLALDFPQLGENTAHLFARLDAIVREAGGRLYPAKDAHMSGEDFRTFYPAWGNLEALRDPALSSRFWQRVIGI